MNNSFIIVNTDDWEALYYKGLLVAEGHSISKSHLTGLMKQHNILDVLYEELTDEGNKLIEEIGMMPEFLNDIKDYFI